MNLKSEYVSYIPIWVAHARRLCAAQAAVETGVLLPGRLRDAEAALRRGLRQARRYRGNLPMALRERALLRAMRGRARGARRDLDASLAEAERQGARYEAAQTLLARGELGRVVGWPGADAEAARARRAAPRDGRGVRVLAAAHAAPGRPCREPVTLSLADRFASIVDQGRRVASALTPDDVHAALCDAAFVLLRGEANLVLAAATAEPRVLASRAAPPSSAVRSSSGPSGRGARSCSRSSSGSRCPESVVLASLRSALCAPIFVGSRSTACLYVTHALVGDLFRDEEKQLALPRDARGRVAREGGGLRRGPGAVAHAPRRERRARREPAPLREAQEELVQAAKMVAVGTLVAGLSHEINNPLSVILGYAHTTLANPGDDPIRPALVAIERQARAAPISSARCSTSRASAAGARGDDDRCPRPGRRGARILEDAPPRRRSSSSTCRLRARAAYGCPGRRSNRPC